MIEFVLGMPPSMLFGDGSTRYLAKSAVKGILPDGLTKHDQANEALRTKARADCLKILQKELAEGKFEGSSSWLDMDTLRKELKGFESEETSSRQTVAKLYAALRIWHLEKRWR